MSYNGEESEQRDDDDIFDTNIEDVLKNMLNHTQLVSGDGGVNKEDQVSIQMMMII